MLLVVINLSSQEITDTLEDDVRNSEYFIEAVAFEDSINIFWLPLNDEDYIYEFELGGYQLVRTELQLNIIDSTLADDGLYDYLIDTLILENTRKVIPSIADTLQPKDSLWMANNANLEEGFMGVLGELFYGEFDPSNEEVSGLASTINYIKYGYETHPDLMKYIGLGYTDKDIEPYKFYRYELVPLFYKGNKDYVDIANFPFAQGRNLENYKVEYEGVEIAATETSNLTLPEADQIASFARAYEDSIVVKWMPSSAELWSKGLESGYKVFKLSTDGSIDTFQVKKWDEDKYRSTADVTSDSVFIAAGMLLYGDYQAGLTTLKEQSDAYQNRYAYAAFTMELSELAATGMGLRLVDNDVSKDSLYSYIIQFQDSNLINLEGIEDIQNTYVPLTKPMDFKAQSGEYSIILSIDKETNEEQFTYYNIERADDGVNFKRINNKPILFAEEDGLNLDKYDYSDSVAVLYKPYTYRIQGINSFGEVSPWATLEAQAIDLTPPPAPSLEFPTQIETNRASIKWQAIEDAPEDFSGYVVQEGNKYDGEFVDISPLLPTTQTSYEYERDFDMTRSYYYQVAAVDVNGNYGSSFPMYMHIIDSIPPAPPENVKGEILEDGTVIVSWDHGDEPDLAGYRVYFANDREDEFTQLTDSLSFINLHQDSLALDVLADSIYYRIEAEDERFNRSEYSEILALTRPDVIPPVAPVLYTPVSIPEGIKLTWDKSASTDVVYNYVYRRVEGADQWETIDSTDAYGVMLIDSTAEYEVIYEYSLRAKDDVDLYSVYTMPLVGRRYFEANLEAVKDISASYNEDDNAIQLQWVYDVSDHPALQGQDYRYVIYRSFDDQPLERLIQRVDKSENFTDNDIEEGRSYKYAIQVLYESGKKSGMSNEAIVQTSDEN